MVKDGAFGHKVDFVFFLFLKDILNLEGHLNRFIGSSYGNFGERGDVT